jgi:glycosyltransferase involved in cell wall biosynthesis
MFLDICGLALRDGRTDDPEWMAARLDLLSALEAVPPVRFHAGAFLVNLGTSWWIPNYFLHVRNAKRQHRIRYVPFVHDCIPILTPEYCVDGLVEEFITWIAGVYLHADSYLVNSQSTGADLARVAKRLGHDAPDFRVIRLDARFQSGSEQPGARDMQDVLARYGLLDQPFVLFVSTVEARKNHALAFNAWKSLIERHGMDNTPMLVCVGTLGWLYEDVVKVLNDNNDLSRKVRILSNVPDVVLETFYRQCLFTIYPSFYEGWGLPVTESLSYGKVPLIASSSSLPEAGGDFAEYFSLDAPAEFAEKLERLITDGSYRAAREAHIRENFRPRDWSDLAGDLVRAVREWAKAEAPAATRDDTIFEAQPATYYALSRNRHREVWPGMTGGEIFRVGTDWWEPEGFGVFTKTPSAALAFRVPRSLRGPFLLYLRMVGFPEKSRKDVSVTVHLRDGEGWSGTLRAGTDRWARLRVSEDTLTDREVFVDIESSDHCDTGFLRDGGRRRIVGAGVGGFFYCAADDTAAQSSLFNAIHFDDWAPVGIRSPQSRFPS